MTYRPKVWPGIVGALAKEDRILARGVGNRAAGGERLHFPGSRSPGKEALELAAAGKTQAAPPWNCWEFTGAADLQARGPAEV
ncbi:MAG: hypothetical protein ACJ8R9_08315 [Steroidobacteraceae bacterium]